jgi:beta-glucosidase
LAAIAGVPVTCVLGALACNPTVEFSPAQIAAHHMLEGAPRGFFLGAASSAHQVEGGTHNDWTEWERGRYPDG